MTPEQVKEHLSRHFIGLVASRRGFKSDVIETDHGTDLSITRATFRNCPQGPRLIDIGTALHVQLKCTCTASTSDDGDGAPVAIRRTEFRFVASRTSESTHEIVLLG